MSVGLIYIHTCQSYIHMPCDFTNGISTALHLRQRISMVMSTCGWVWPERLLIHAILSFWGAKFPKRGDSLSWMPMNRCGKCNTASFILGGEICNRSTNKQ